MTRAQAFAAALALLRFGLTVRDVRRAAAERALGRSSRLSAETSPSWDTTGSPSGGPFSSVTLSRTRPGALNWQWFKISARSPITIRESAVNIPLVRFILTVWRGRSKTGDPPTVR